MRRSVRSTWNIEKLMKTKQNQKKNERQKNKSPVRSKAWFTAVVFVSVRVLLRSGIGSLEVRLVVDEDLRFLAAFNNNFFY